MEAFRLQMGLAPGKHLDWFISRYYQASEIYNSCVVNLSCSVLYFHESKSETETVQWYLHISSPSLFPDLFRLESYRLYDLLLIFRRGGNALSVQLEDLSDLIH